MAADATPTQPYWLAQPRPGPVFSWAGVPLLLQGLPFAPPDVTARVMLTIGGVPLTLVRGLEYRYADSVRGEIRRPVAVVPVALRVQATARRLRRRY